MVWTRTKLASSTLHLDDLSIQLIYGLILMARYYCPYCSTRYPLHCHDKQGRMVCGHCGDPLLKVQLIDVKQVFALFVACAFAIPSILLVFSVFQDSSSLEKNDSLSANLYVD